MEIKLSDGVEYLRLNKAGQGKLWKRERGKFGDKALQTSMHIAPLAQETLDCIAMADMLWNVEVDSTYIPSFTWIEN